MLYLNKWLAEQSWVSACLLLPGLNVQSYLLGYITELGPRLVVSHPEGASDGYLACPWDEVVEFHYAELRNADEQLKAYPSVVEAMRDRPNIILILKNGACVLLTDLLS